MMYRIGQLVAPRAPTAFAYVCQDMDTGELRLILGDGENTAITAPDLRRLAFKHGLRIELRYGIPGFTNRLERRGARSPAIESLRPPAS
jgi:hypothetical protein